ncbi:MAG: LPS-assembly protein LptD, partial [Candidatus Binatia bacterium]
MPVASAEKSPTGFGGLQVQSSPEATEIRIGLSPAAPQQDRTNTRSGRSAAGQAIRVLPPDRPVTTEIPKPIAPAVEPPIVQPGAITVDEIHLFFPGATLDRPRLITVGDRIVEEARLFPEPGGVGMTVVVRRPVYYTLSRQQGMLRIRVEPATLLLAEPTGPEVAPPAAPARTSGRRGRDRDLQEETAVPKLAIPELQKGEGLTVDAEQLDTDQERNEIVAKGHVTIARASSLLTADQVRINRDTQVAEAIGNVQLTDPQGTIQADSFTGNLEDETGTLVNGNIFLTTNHLTISGAKLEKSFGQTYHIEDGSFTTCQCGVGAPSWSIAGDSIDVTLDGYGLVQGAKFKVLDTPILYLPVVPFPAKTTRQSGLLAPQFGYSKKRGVTFLQPFFLVINKSADATLSFDIETNARIGGIAEYRYALDERSKGVLDFSYFNEALRNNPERDIVETSVADPTIPEDRWSVTANVRQELPLEIRGFADALAVSDDLFLREIPTFSFDPDHTRSFRTSRFTSSRGGLYRFWDHATLIGQAIYFQDFVQEDDLT